MKASEGEQSPLIIASGLPRSGTSLLMQMLGAGGVPLTTDQHRPADEHNPRGYFEDERAKRVGVETGWLANERGRAVKIVVPLVTAVAESGLPARVLLVMRPLPAVLESQRRLAKARGHTVKSRDQRRLRVALAASLEGTLNKLERAPNVELLLLTYGRILSHPREEANRIAQFLELPLELEAMAGVVEPRLRHVT